MSTRSLGTQSHSNKYTSPSSTIIASSGCMYNEVTQPRPINTRVNENTNTYAVTVPIKYKPKTKSKKK